MSYRQLTLDERYQIQTWVRMGMSNAAIGRWLGRHPSTISRERHRNSDTSCVQPYTAARAHRRTRGRRVAKGIASRKVQGELQELVEQKLRLGWSPEQISGRLWLESKLAVSHETIYQHVIRDTQQQGILRYCLRFGGYKQHRMKKSKHGARTRQRKNWIHERPATANRRAEVGHWERDCVLGKRGEAALLTLVDRRSRYTLIRRVAKVDVEHVAAATVEALRPHRDLTRTMTNDNGTEFQRDESLQKQLGVPIYFTEPSSPWQRGSIENLNGLVRQYVPKQSDIGAFPDWTPRALEETLNFRPRKVLGFRTPHEVFYMASTALTGTEAMRLGLEFSPSI
jgi:IS30 family transposase